MSENNAIRVSKPTNEQLAEWDSILKAEGLTDPDEPWRDHIALEHTHGVKVPAQSTKGEGYFWKRAGEIYDAKWDRGKKQPNQFVCEACGESFVARKGSKFCSTRCRVRGFRSR